MREQGKLITLEGCEGVGKSTQIRMLQAYLDEAGCETLFVREPGSTSIGERIRALLIDPSHRDMHARCEALLYCAARAQMIESVVRPALRRGTIVVCDRFIDSTYAYQGIARNLGGEAIAALNRFACDDIAPDLTFFLDLPPEQGFRRKGGADVADRMEGEALAFHQDVYRGYCAAAEREPQRIVRIDASADAQSIHAQIVQCLRARVIVR